MQLAISAVLVISEFVEIFARGELLFRGILNFTEARSVHRAQLARLAFALKGVGRGGGHRRLLPGGLLLALLDSFLNLFGVHGGSRFTAVGPSLSTISLISSFRVGRSLTAVLPVNQAAALPVESAELGRVLLTVGGEGTSLAANHAALARGAG